jgi:hypothetical protein
LRGRCARPDYSSIPGKSASNTDRTGAQGESEALRRTPLSASCSSFQSPGRESKSRGSESKSGGRKSKAGGRESKACGRKSKIKSPNFLLRIERFQGLAPTPTALPLRSCCAASGLGAAGLRSFASGGSSFAWSSFRVLRSLEAGEGLAPFSIADAWAPFVRLERPSGSRARTEGTHFRAESPRTGDKTGDRSDVGKELSPLKKPEPVSSLWVADGRQPFMPDYYLTNPAFEPYPFGFAMRGGSGRFPSARLRRLSSSDGSLCHNSDHL